MQQPLTVVVVEGADLERVRAVLHEAGLVMREAFLAGHREASGVVAIGRALRSLAAEAGAA